MAGDCSVEMTAREEGNMFAVGSGVQDVLVGSVHALLSLCKAAIPRYAACALPRAWGQNAFHAGLPFAAHCSLSMLCITTAASRMACARLPVHSATRGANCWTPVTLSMYSHVMKQKSIIYLYKQTPAYLKEELCTAILHLRTPCN